MSEPDRIWIDRGPNGGWMFRVQKMPDSVAEYVPAKALAEATARAEAAEARVKVLEEALRECGAPYLARPLPRIRRIRRLVKETLGGCHG